MTGAQLSKLLYDLGVPPEIYRLDGSHYELAHVLAHRDGGWVVFLSERGGESDAVEFANEHEACVFILGRMFLELVERDRFWIIQ